MIIFPVLIPVQNFLFPGTGRENLKCYGKGRDGKFEACIPGNHGKRDFPLTPVKEINAFYHVMTNFVSPMYFYSPPSPAKQRKRSRQRDEETEIVDGEE